MTPEPEPLSAPRWRIRRSAAVAGIVFAVLLMVGLVIVRSALSGATPSVLSADPGRRHLLQAGLNLVPFAGIAFLWFIGVIRDRLGLREDRFFATVFLGSGLVFVAMLFAASAVTVSLATGFRGGVHSSADSVQTWRFGGSLAHALLTTFGMRMAAVFMISTATLTYRSGVVPRWLGLAGYACALALLVGVNVVGWIELLFPLWVLLISSYFLIENRRRTPAP